MKLDKYKLVECIEGRMNDIPFYQGERRGEVKLILNKINSGEFDCECRNELDWGDIEKEINKQAQNRTQESKTVFGEAVKSDWIKSSNKLPPNYFECRIFIRFHNGHVALSDGGTVNEDFTAGVKQIESWMYLHNATKYIK